MTNMIAFWLGLFIIVFFVLDHFVFQWDVIIHAMRGLLFLISKLAIWR